MINFFRKKYIFWVILLISLVLFIAYGQTLQMYFWQDDFALLFKLQHQAGPAGSYGEGIIGQGAYKYLVTPFVPFFAIFGIDQFGYFLIGFLAYIAGLVAFYFFTNELFQNKKAAIFSTFIYAAGYIGSGTMFRLGNSWQTNFGIILALFSFFFFTKFLYNRKNFKNYLLALFFFFLATEFVYIRSHSLVVPIFVLDFLFLMIPFQIKKLPGFILRQLPFFLIFYFWYLKGGTMGSSSLGLIISQFLSGKIVILASFFAIVGNTLIPDQLQKMYLNVFPNHSQLFLLFIFLVITWFLLIFFKSTTRARILTIVFLFLAYFLNRYFQSASLYWYRSTNAFVSGAIGMYFSVLILSLSAILWKKQKNLSVTLSLGLIILISQIFGYFVQYPQAIFNSTHHYLSYAFIGYCLIFGTLIYLFFEGIQKVSVIPKKFRNLVAIFPLGFIILPNLILGFSYQKNIVENRSLPIKNFYQRLMQFIPAVNKGALFYFDINSDSHYQQQFQDFFSVGSMPNQTALAVFYNVDRYDLAMTTDFNELLFNLTNKKISIDNIYSFYFGTSDLHNISKDTSLLNTTTHTRDLLKNGSKEEAPNWENVDNTLFIKDVKTFPATPMLLTLKLKIAPDLNKIEKSLGSKKIESDNNWQQLMAYLVNRKIYYKNVKASSLSEWKYQEIYNAVDNDLETSWRGHRIYWHDNKHEQIVLDLGFIQNISEIIWVNWNNTLTPTSYTIDISGDNINWKTVKKVINGPERTSGEAVSEKFASVPARFVRMDITSTLSNDAPALKEIEVINSESSLVNTAEAFKFISSPLSFAATKNEANLMLSQIALLINLEVEIKTDKEIFIQHSSVNSFDAENVYEFVLVPGGTKIEYLSVKINNLPANPDLLSASIRNLSFTEIQERGLIKYLTK